MEQHASTEPRGFESDRVRSLERRLRRTQMALAGIGLAGLTAVLVGMADGPGGAETTDELRTRKLVVVDDRGVPRVVISQDPVDGQRRARSAGLTLHDKDGVERGGMGTFDDGSVVFALDAPQGVGAPMRDRIGLVVYPNGAAHVMLLDNKTRAVAKLYSDGEGGGGPQVFRWDMDAREVHVKTMTFDGEETSVSELGG